MSQDETAVNTEVVADTTVTESAPVETKETAADTTDVLEASLEDLEADAPADETDSPVAPEEDSKEEPKADDTKADDPQEGEKPLAPKSENRFQKLANENRELRERLAQLNSRETQVATEQELMNQVNPETGDYYTPAEAERIARYQANEQTQQALAQERYQLEVQSNQQSIATEAQKALTDFPMFDETNKEYNASLAAQADQLMSQSLLIENGVIVGAKISPYQIYKTIADSISYGATKGQVEAQKATQQMLASVDASPSASQASKPKEDPMLEAFKKEAGL
jgi:hypothetical protein